MVALLFLGPDDLDGELTLPTIIGLQGIRESNSSLYNLKGELILPNNTSRVI